MTHDDEGYERRKFISNYMRKDLIRKQTKNKLLVPNVKKLKFPPCIRVYNELAAINRVLNSKNQVEVKFSIYSDC